MRSIFFCSLLAIAPVCAFAAEAAAQTQPADETKVAEIQALLQKWAQLRAGMTLEEVEAVVGPLDQRFVVTALVSAGHLAPQVLQDSPEVMGMTQEITQSYNIRGSRIPFKLVFNAKGKLVKYGLDLPPQK